MPSVSTCSFIKIHVVQAADDFACVVTCLWKTVENCNYFTLNLAFSFGKSTVIYDSDSYLAVSAISRNLYHFEDKNSILSS